ncbi:lysophospholipid acyltransferase family protein [Congregibacter sp.]|uniref:lysophospholipid acyltransferase family protein n=1 Tax=Congregibacter sp. TaxID=2744308 RepID=UPI003F6DA143
MTSRLISALLWLASRLPLGSSRVVGRTLGKLVWLAGGSSRQVTERNIGLAFPDLDEAEQAQLAQRSLQATGELIAEMGFVWHRPWRKVREKIVEIRGEDAVKEALAEDRGVVILGPHLGNWEVMGLFIAEWGDALALYKPPRMQALESVVREARERTGTRLVPTTPRGLATLVKTLKRGGVTGILPDQIPSVEESGENSSFMGVPCFTMTFASKLLHRTGAAAFFGFAERVPGGFRIHLIPAEESMYSDDLDVSLQALNDGIEACLSLCPEQYQWEYKRFRTRPRNLVDYYSPDWTPDA